MLGIGLGILGLPLRKRPAEAAVADYSIATADFKNGVYAKDGAPTTIEEVFPGNDPSPYLVEGVGLRFETDEFGTGGTSFQLTDIIPHEGFYLTVDLRVEATLEGFPINGSWSCEWTVNPAFSPYWGMQSSAGSPDGIAELEVETYSYVGNDEDGDFSPDINHALASGGRLRIAGVLSPANLAVSSNGQPLSAADPTGPWANPDRNFVTMTFNIFRGEGGAVPAALIVEKIRLDLIDAHAPEDLPAMCAVA